MAALLALGVAELVAGWWRSAPSLVVAVGDTVIDEAPDQAVSTGIDLFGTNDKQALVIGTVVLCAVLGALTGLASRRRPVVAPVVFGAFAVLGVAASTSSEGSSLAGAAVAGGVGAGAGVLALRLLLRSAERWTPSGAAAEGPAPSPSVLGQEPRRTFLVQAGLVALGAACAGGLGRRLAGRFSVADIRAGIDVDPASIVTGEAVHRPAFSVPGLVDRVTTNEDFYRIDTAIVVPQVDPGRWQLDVTGLVREPVSYTFDELVARASFDDEVTLACVSNGVGGDLVGNARWTGVPLRDLLEPAGVLPRGTQLLGVSVDGFTAGFPTDLALDGRPAIVAVGMNGEPLPVDHGFPARLVVSGLYGYVSATKWLSEIRLTSFDDVDGYWIPRGWAKEAPIKIQSRIDTPRTGATIAPGLVPIAGVAWAQPHGIERVQVEVDGGPWTDARLDDLATVHTWRQWYLPWEATPGEHVLAVRATNGSGTVQTSHRQGPVPDGSTGHHTVTVQVRAGA